MVMDFTYDKWLRQSQQVPYHPERFFVPGPPIPSVTERDVNDFEDLLRRAREYDRKNNEPACEESDKRAKLRRLADQLGVKIAFLDEPEESEDSQEISVAAS